VDFANPATFPAEYQNYQPGLSEQKDLGYHTFLARVMVKKMTQNPAFLEHYGAAYGIDATTLKNLTEADLQNYEIYRDIVPLYMRMIHVIYQNGGEYQPLPFDQWAIEQMLQSKNPVHAWVKDDGSVSYGFGYNNPIDKKWLDILKAEDVPRAQEIWRELMKNNPDIFRTTINGHEVTASRTPISGPGASVGDMKAINLGYMEMPDYPNTLILIAGAFDENGNRYLQPFVVNYGRTPLPDGKVWTPTENTNLWGRPNDYHNQELLEEVLYNRDELLSTIGHVVILSTLDYRVLNNDIPYEQITNFFTDFDTSMTSLQKADL
jgi:hypothetical protein